ncbi:MAG: DUF3368 domain-containing protein [Aridibacter sp.]
MIVIADTSPLNYLVLIGQENLLPKFFGQVIIPQAVFDELNDAGASVEVRNWLREIPNWIEIKQIGLASNASLDIWDTGEREAILLAQELSADLLLVDDKQARQAAVDFGIAITGILGILDRAAQKDLLDLSETLDKLQKTSFRASEKLISNLIQLDAERKLKD